MCQQNNEYKVFVQFVINGNNIPTIEEFNRIFEYKGTGFNKGDHYCCRKGREKLVRSYSAWSIDSEHIVRSYNILDHLNFILILIESKIHLLRFFLDSLDVTVFIRIWVESDDCIARVTIPSPILARLANICNELYVVAISCEGAHVDSIEP